ncbi:stalk domain-containing protein [Gorillibacterium sp. CAU 1737]|uniref:stalk domain-containing protein n=1 Tax=Gorillibacterium sp. CAU 1737 TaxID=3140362 RepID=UPI003261AD41
MKPSWKKTMLTLTASGVGFAAMALPVAAAQKPVVQQVKVSLDGQQEGVRVIESNGTSLIAIRDLANSFGIVPEYAKGQIVLNTEVTVELTVGSTAYRVNGEEKAFTIAPYEVAGSVFAPLNELVEALGGTVEKSGSNILIQSFQLAEGEFSSVRWISNDRVLAVREDDHALVLIDTLSKRSTVLIADADAAGLVLSPDGKTGIYTLGNGTVKTINLATGILRTVTKDSSVKTDLVWSADGKTVYFIQGDNQEKLASLNVETGVISKVLEDKVTYKSDLRVSADSKKLLYLVNITGTAKNDSNSTEESLTIDYSTAGTQLVSLELGKADAKPVVLTFDAANKLYPQLLKDGSAAYIRIDPAAADPVGALELVTGANQQKEAALGLDVLEASLNAAGDLLVLGSNKSGLLELHQVQPDGTSKSLSSFSLDLSNAVVSLDGQHTIGTVDGKVVLAAGSSVQYLTK